MLRFTLTGERYKDVQFTSGVDSHSEMCEAVKQEFQIPLEDEVHIYNQEGLEIPDLAHALQVAGTLMPH